MEPYASVRAAWSALVEASPAASIYHRHLWMELLERSYGFRITIASIRRQGEILAACAFARSGVPFAKRLVALPFSDDCAPLVSAGFSAEVLLELLPAQGPAGARYEVRDVIAPKPWQTVDCFQTWTLDLNRPVAAMHRALDSNFRRNLKQAAMRKIEIERGTSLDFLRRFYALVLDTRRRLGLPPQPWKFFRNVHSAFAPSGAIEIWLARSGRTDEAAAVFLRDRASIYFKWAARKASDSQAAYGVNHLLVWNAVEAFAGQANFLDLGRTDIRNEGLNRFKRGVGATSRPLPYSFYPEAPAEPSSEVFHGRRKVLADIWRRLPLPATRILGGALYRFLG